MSGIQCLTKKRTGKNSNPFLHFLLSCLEGGIDMSQTTYIGDIVKCEKITMKSPDKCESITGYRVRFGPFGSMRAYVPESEIYNRDKPKNPLVKQLQNLIKPYVVPQPITLAITVVPELVTV